ncbi:MAG: SUMF1/EgtB/PvdO family nonheme iron enzyme [Sulfuriflexus sp.]|nr:SUMF1/EgtB/PvdO family nonheme iron enzyme [Sulfuriflexus sp.]
MGAVKPNEELSSALRTLVPISALSEEKFTDLQASTHIEEIAAGEQLFKEGDVDSRAIYLLAGKVVMMSGKSIADTLIGGTEPSRYPLAHHIPRQLSAVAKTAVSFVRIDTKLLDTLLTSDSNQGDTYEVSEILEEDESDWMTQMLQSEAFSNLPPESIQALFMYMEEYAVTAGMPVIQQGEPGDYYYMVRRGRCKVVVETNGQSKVVAELGPGDSFGEEALISDNPRNASVVMLTSGIMMRLAQKDFEELMKQPLIKWLTLDEAQELVDGGAVWLDVRTPNEHEKDCIEGSHNLPLSLLRSKADRLKETRKYITYCDNGKRSSVASFLLSQRGLDSYVLAGGYVKEKPKEKIVVPVTKAEPIKEAVKEIKEPDNVVALNAASQADAKKKNDATAKAQEEAEQRANDESARRAQVEDELAKLKQAQQNAKEMAENETRKRLKAEAAVEKMKKDQEIAVLKAEEEIKKRKDVEADAARIKKEAKAAQIKAEKEVKKLEGEREQARQKAEAELATLRKQRKDAEQQAIEQAELVRKEVSEERIKAEENSAKLKQEAEAARLAAEKDAKRIRDEASAEKEQAEKEIMQLQKQQKQAKEKAEAEALRFKEEASRVREEARIKSEKMASQIVAEAEQAKFEAEQQASQLIAEAEGERLQAEAEHASFLSSQEAARLKAEQEVMLLKAEANKVRLHAEEEQQKMREMEASRLSAEEEANRIKVEAEVSRREIEDEMNRRQSEAEAIRLKAEEEATRIKADAEAARFKAEEEAARLTAEVEKVRLDVENENAESVAQLEAEADAARIEAEEARRMRDEAETARLEAEQNAEEVRKETESAREQAVVDAQKIIDSAEETRVKVEDEAKQVKETAEQAQQEAEAESARLAEETQLARQQAEKDALRLKEEADQAQQRSDDVISRMKAEAEELKRTAGIEAEVEAKAAEEVKEPEPEIQEAAPEDVQEEAIAESVDEVVTEEVIDIDDLIITEIPSLEGEDDDDESGLIIIGGDDSAKDDDFVVVPSSFVHEADEQDDIERLINEAVDDVESVFESQFTEQVIQSQFIPDQKRNKNLLFAGIGGAVVVVIGIIIAVLSGDDDVPEVVAIAPMTEQPVISEPQTAEVVVEQEQKPAPIAEVKPEPVKKVAVAVPPFKVRYVKDRMKIGGRGPEMSILPAGSYEMGSPSSSVEFTERPKHKVTLKSFAISRYEITVAEYKRFLQATGLKRNASVSGKKSNQPVGSVNWDDANKYAKWLSKQTGKKYRLPTESEWEYAALSQKRSLYTWGNTLTKNEANCFDCGSQWDSVSVAPVGSFASNAFGLSDMIGNVMEWTQDCKNRNYKGARKDGSAWLRGDCSFRSVRGGAFDTPGGDLYIKRRKFLPTGSRLDSVGIRLVRE